MILIEYIEEYKGETEEFEMYVEQAENLFK